MFRPNHVYVRNVTYHNYPTIPATAPRTPMWRHVPEVECSLWTIVTRSKKDPSPLIVCQRSLVYFRGFNFDSFAREIKINALSY